MHQVQKIYAPAADQAAKLYSANADHPARGKKNKIVILGDCLAADYSPLPQQSDGSADSNPYSFCRLIEESADDYFNGAVDGMTTEKALHLYVQSFQKAIADKSKESLLAARLHEAQSIVICAGTEDLIHSDSFGFTARDFMEGWESENAKKELTQKMMEHLSRVNPAEIKSNMVKILSFLYLINPHAKIYLLNVPNTMEHLARDFEYDQIADCIADQINRLNASLEEAASIFPNTRVINIHSLFEGRARQLLQPFDMHLNQKGHQVIYNALLQAGLFQ